MAQRTEDSFAGLVRPHLDRMTRAARRVLCCPDLAQDALQEALLVLWRDGPPSVDLCGWLVRTVVHRSLHLRRTRMRARRRELMCGPDCHHEEQDPHTGAEAAELREAFGAAVDGLEESRRAILILREMEGLEYSEIARRTDLPIGTVRSRLHRARSMLADRLRPYGGGAGQA